MKLKDEAYKGHQFVEDQLRLLYKPLKKLETPIRDYVACKAGTITGIFTNSIYGMPDAILQGIQSGVALTRIFGQMIGVPNNEIAPGANAIGRFFATYQTLIGFTSFVAGGTAATYGLIKGDSELATAGSITMSKGALRIGTHIPAFLRDDTKEPEERNKKRKEKIKEKAKQLEELLLPKPVLQPSQTYFNTLDIHKESI